MESEAKTPICVFFFFSLLFILAAVSSFFCNGFAKSLVRGKELGQQPINSGNWFLYLDIQSSALLSDPIRRGVHTVIHAQFEY